MHAFRSAARIGGLRARPMSTDLLVDILLGSHRIAWESWPIDESARTKLFVPTTHRQLAEKRWS